MKKGEDQQNQILDGFAGKIGKVDKDGGAKKNVTGKGGKGAGESGEEKDSKREKKKGR